MRTAVTIGALALTLAVGACSGAPGQEFTKEDRESIQQSTRALTAAFNAKDLDTVANMYTDDSVFMPPNAPLTRGRDSVKTFYSGLVTRGAELQMESEEVMGHGPLGFESGTYTIQYPGDGQPSRDRGKYLRVLRNMSGTWRVEKTIWSSDLPRPAGTTAN